MSTGLNTLQRIVIAGMILSAGVVLGAFAGFPAEALRWERFASAYEDVVVVTRAEYRADDGELRVRAESSSPTSTLIVYDLAGVLIGVMEREDALRHEGRFDVSTDPVVITVRSSEGGTATVLVTGDNPPTVTLTPGPSVTPTIPSTATGSPGTPVASETPAEATPTATEGAAPSVTPVASTPSATPTDGSTPPTPATTPEGRIMLPAALSNAELARD